MSHATSLGAPTSAGSFIQEPQDDDLLSSSAAIENTDLDRIYDQCKRQLIKDRAVACVRARRSYVTTSDGSTCKQHLHFRIHSVCNCNILVHIVAPRNHLHQDRARIALATGFQTSNPTLLLDSRFPFLECRWPDDTLHKDDPANLKELVRRHLMLCDWMESTLQALKAGQPCDLPHHGILPTENHIILPTMRAILMIFWPAAIDSEDSLGSAAIVLTGDDSRMRSGPIKLDSLREYQLPGFINDVMTAYVPFERAACFLAELDKREIAANTILRDRNERSAHDLGEYLMRTAKERLALLWIGETSDYEIGFQRQEEQAEERRKEFVEKLGYSNLQAKLAARATLY